GAGGEVGLDLVAPLDADGAVGGLGHGAGDAAVVQLFARIVDLAAGAEGGEVVGGEGQEVVARHGVVFFEGRRSDQGRERRKHTTNKAPSSQNAAKVNRPLSRKMRTCSGPPPPVVGPPPVLRLAAGAGKTADGLEKRGGPLAGMSSSTTPDARST